MSLFAIPSDRTYLWTDNVGVAGGIPDSGAKTVFTTLPEGSSAATVNSALGSCPANQVVKLAAGNYTWTERLDWRGVNDGVVLKGASPNLGIGTGSRITFSTYSLAGMLMWGDQDDSAASMNIDANLTADAVQGGATLTLASVPTWVTVGKIIGIDQLDDPAFVDNTIGPEGGESAREFWIAEERSMGMFNRVLGKTATTISLEIPLIWGFQTSRTAQIFKPHNHPESQNFLKGCGVEDLYIKDNFSSGGARTIFFLNADSCYLKNVEIDSSADIPVFAYYSYRCEVRHCYLHNMRLVGSGQGYGIALYYYSTNWLVEDNIVRDSHNALTANYSSPGNVWAYNYVLLGASGSGTHPSMNYHGVHCTFNLFEGNHAQLFTGDITHGSSSHATLFRNRIAGGTGNFAGTCVVVQYFTRYCNIIANVLGDGTANKYVCDQSSQSHGSTGDILFIGASYDTGVAPHNGEFQTSDANSYTSGALILVHGNWDSVQSVQTFHASFADHDFSNSLFRSAKPSYFGSLAWPPYDPTASSNTQATRIPAGYRYVNGSDPPAGGSPPNAPTNLRIA